MVRAAMPLLRRFALRASLTLAASIAAPAAAAIAHADEAAAAPTPGEDALPPPAIDVAPPTSSASLGTTAIVEGSDATKSASLGTSSDHPACAGCDRDEGDAHDDEGEGSVHAGYKAGQFFLRDDEDRFYLIPTGRLQVDTYGFAGPSVSDYQRSSNGTGLKANLALRRLRVELAGRILHHWYFWLGGDFGGSQPLDATQRPAPFAAATDAFVGYEACTWFRWQVGQFDVPFTMENVTSDKWLNFMERSLTVRAAGAPYNKDLGLMIRGEAPSGSVNYAFALVGGDGQNRPSVDNRGDFMGRILVRPFSKSKGSIVERAHIGVSGRWGRRDPTYVRYDAPVLSTPGGYNFWSPTYGVGAAETHVVPSGVQRAIDFELFLPLGRFDLQAEAMLLHEGRREAFASSLANTERAGTLTGGAYYVQLAFWPLGEPRLPGEPGKYPDPKIPAPDAETKAPRALQLVARWEQLMLDYDSLARSTAGDGSLVAGVKRGALDAATSSIRINAFQFGMTYWATKHVRVTGVYSLYAFPGSQDAPIENEAMAPGAKASARNTDARLLHEFSARIAIAL